MQQVSRAGTAWVVALLAVVVLGGGWYRESRQRDQDQAAVDARLSRLEGSPGAMVGQDQLAIDSSVAPIPRAPMASVRSSNVRMGAPGAYRPLSPEERRRLQLQALAKLESKFSADGYDPRWAASTEKSVAQAAEEPALAPFPAPTASDVRCARTMCRLVFTFDSLDQAEDWSTYYPLGVAKGLPVFQSQSTVLPDGRVELRMYGFRDPQAKTQG